MLTRLLVVTDVKRSPHFYGGVLGAAPHGEELLGKMITARTG